VSSAKNNMQSLTLRITLVAQWTGSSPYSLAASNHTLLVTENTSIAAMGNLSPIVIPRKTLSYPSKQDKIDQIRRLCYLPTPQLPSVSHLFPWSRAKFLVSRILTHI
jgi:hypothetical protein